MTAGEQKFSLGNLLWLMAGLTLAIAPHAAHLPVWITLIATILFGWRIYLGWGGHVLPHKWLLLAFAGASLFGIYLSFQTIVGRDAGLGLLVVFLGLKLLEMKNHRDAYAVMFLAYFLVLTNFFYSQTIATAVLMLLTVLMITTSLVNFQTAARSYRDNLKTAGLLLAQAVPVMLLLFFLFPRVQGPLWGLPQDAYSGITGLSDSMSPGMISKLSQSDAVAFYAKFQGEPPPKGQLYWRGPVFWEYDGRTWRPGDMRITRRAPTFQGIGRYYEYAVTLEPHNRNWMFALDLPATIPSMARVTTDYQLLAFPVVRSRIRYELRSYPEYIATDAERKRDIDDALDLPAGYNPRARQLAESWRRESADDAAAIVNRALDYFRNQGFEYTLEPPLLTSEHTVDEFLFGSKRGFCEHFAGSFAFLMRAAGVPARIVTGYQGGDLNPVDQYLIVRQSDAHAWVEVRVNGGWRRVDPTAVVSPLRVESGIAQAVPATEPLPFMARTEQIWLLRLRYNWEALANQWNQWVLGYNPERQREMLSRLGMTAPSWQSMAMALFWATAGVLGLLALWLLRRARLEDPAQRAWRRFCARLARAGLPRAPSEGPADYIARAVLRFPRRAEAAQAIGSLYIDARYGRSGDDASMRQLGRLVREFRL
jgi:transglutaminase-like putative cysteine protease